VRASARFCVVVLLSLCTAHAFAQVDSLNMKASPRGGMAALALVYFKIDFAAPQRDYLRQHEAELVFFVDEQGRAKLEKVNDIEDPVIIDSMMNVNHRLPEFSPELRNGQPQSTLYFMRIQWPQYEMNPLAGQLGKYPISAFEKLETNSRMDVVIGGQINGFIGNAAEYLKLGGGMRILLTYPTRTSLGVGMALNIYGNSLRKNYPVPITGPPNDAPPTMLIGFAISKPASRGHNSRFSFTFEANYAVHNIVSVDQTLRNEPVQAQGFSPSFTVDYLIPIGKGYVMLGMFGGHLTRNFISIHASVRPIFYDIKEASGVMLDLGVSWRIAGFRVTEYKLR
jgi:hypothetical protein